MLEAVRPVVEALVITEEEAKRLCVNVLRKRSVEDPRENVLVTDGVVLPAIWRRSVGIATPTPTLPLPRILKSCAPDEEATANGLAVPAIPRTESVAIGVEDPIPSLSLVASKKKLVLSCDTSPLAPMNGTDPCVRPER